MLARKLLFAQFNVIALICFLHLSGFWLYLYWMFWWYDIIVHTLGGIWISLTVSWLYAHRGQSVGWGITLAIVLFISVGWEFFEYAIGLSQDPVFSRFFFDTALDFLMDTAGGIIGFILAKRMERTLQSKERGTMEGS